MTQWLREFFARADRGYSRAELKDVVRGVPEFASMVSRRRSGFYEAVRRLAAEGSVVEMSGLLYPAAGSARGEKR